MKAVREAVPDVSEEEAAKALKLAEEDKKTGGALLEEEREKFRNSGGDVSGVVDKEEKKRAYVPTPSRHCRGCYWW
jgi:hypothetical protein